MDNKTKLLYKARMNFANNPQMKAIILAATGFSLFACGDALIKHVSSLYNTYTIVAFNEFFVISYFLLMSPKLGGFKQTLKSPYLKWHFVRGVFVVLQIATIIYSFSQMSMVKTYALVFSAPFFTTLLARIILKEQVSFQNWLSLLVGFCGVMIILRPGLIPLDLPSMAALFSALCFAGYNLIAKRYNHGETLLALGLLPRLVFFLALPVFLFKAEMPQLIHIPYFMIMALTGASGFLAITLAFIKAPAGIVAPFHYVQMLWATLFGYLFFKDPVDLPTSIGAFVIIGSGLWLIKQQRRYKESAPPV